jgi:hypothetical protein
MSAPRSPRAGRSAPTRVSTPSSPPIGAARKKPLPRWRAPRRWALDVASLEPGSYSLQLYYRGVVLRGCSAPGQYLGRLRESYGLALDDGLAACSDADLQVGLWVQGLGSCQAGWQRSPVRALCGWRPGCYATRGNRLGAVSVAHFRFLNRLEIIFYSMQKSIYIMNGWNLIVAAVV